MGEHVIEATPISSVQPQDETVSSSRQQDKGKSIATTPEPEIVLKPASTIVRQDPGEPIRVPFEINGVIHHLTDAEIQAYLERDEILKMVAVEDFNDDVREQNALVSYP